MADAEYMIDNYSEAQNQGCWSNYDEEMKETMRLVDAYLESDEYKNYDPDCPVFKEISMYDCNDESCSNYIGIPF